MLEEIYAQTKDHMEKSIEALKKITNLKNWKKLTQIS